MKNNSLSSHCGTVIRGAFVLLSTANLCLAQNFVKNPDFEEPLGPDNWTIVYVYPSGPCDFLVAGRTTTASKDIVPGTWDGGVGGSTNYWNKLGGHFMPNHVGQMHAYFRQVVSGLQPGSNYVCSAWMVQYGRFTNPNHLADEYMETIGTQDLRTDSVTNNASNNPYAWAMYALTNAATPSGQIEIQLHYNKTRTIAYGSNPWEYRNCNGYFDRVAVVPEGQTDFQPPYSIVSFDHTGPDVGLLWETVMNNRYRIQASANVADPASWHWVERSPLLDTFFSALGTSLTFTTNVPSMFYYDPPAPSLPPEWRTRVYFDPDAPLFLRIYAESYQP